MAKYGKPLSCHKQPISCHEMAKCDNIKDSVIPQIDPYVDSVSGVSFI